MWKSCSLPDAGRFPWLSIALFPLSVEKVGFCKEILPLRLAILENRSPCPYQLVRYMVEESVKRAAGYHSLKHQNVSVFLSMQTRTRNLTFTLQSLLSSNSPNTYKLSKPSFSKVCFLRISLTFVLLSTSVDNMVRRLW